MIGRRARTGQNLVEFALVAPLLFLFVFGVVEFGWAFYVHSELTNAAREGARYAAVHGDLCAEHPPCQRATSESVRAYILDRLSVPEADRIAVMLQGSLAPGERVTIQVSYPFRPLVGFVLPVGGFTMRTSSSMIVHY
ncbi:pilus assembly protein [Thermomicrobium sp. 4228-Ro]|uniref:TadE/TadG family type IV pilus assembly protein n=1 Tax=Thermomicrobium sp. 4228-Ro TaxID=2993937 RepID=UPI002248CBB0|nr:TadE family protein [Thermomicrobium sp. 4228-Ro]MCX2727779.1 pilus assembly protein [Thermomicrobium sp. 4228-Ro]